MVAATWLHPLVRRSSDVRIERAHKGATLSHVGLGIERQPSRRHQRMLRACHANYGSTTCVTAPAAVDRASALGDHLDPAHA